MLSSFLVLCCCCLFLLMFLLNHLIKQVFNETWEVWGIDACLLCNNSLYCNFFADAALKAWPCCWCAFHMDNIMLSVSVQSLQSGCLSLRVSSPWLAQTCSSNAPSVGLLSRLWRGGWMVTLCRVSPTAHSTKCCVALWFMFFTPPFKTAVHVYRAFWWTKKQFLAISL